MTIEVWCDGSSHAKGDKPIGWGFVVEVDGKVVDLNYGGAPTGTNNIAELTGAIEGLKAAERWIEGPASVTLVSDSQYTLGMACGRYNPSKNLELVAELRSLCKRMNVEVRWVKGHAGVDLNELADNLAGYGKREELEKLKEE